MTKAAKWKVLVDETATRGLWALGETGWLVRKFGPGVFRVYTPDADWYTRYTLQSAQQLAEANVPKS